MILKAVAGLAVAATLAAGVQTWRVGRLETRVDTLTTQLAASRAETATERARAASERDARQTEAVQSEAAYGALTAACAANVAKARVSATTIERVIRDVRPTPENPSPGVRVLDAGELRRIAGQVPASDRPDPLRPGDDHGGRP